MFVNSNGRGRPWSSKVLDNSESGIKIADLDFTDDINLLESIKLELKHSINRIFEYGLRLFYHYQTSGGITTNMVNGLVSQDR